MKPALLSIILALLLSSCSSFIHNYTYMPLQPNQPAFEKGGEAHATATTGISHSEFQGAVSPIKYLSLKGSYFGGFIGQKSFNYGGGVYAPLFSVQQWKAYASADYYIGEGNIGGARQYAPMVGGKMLDIFNVYYTSNTQQLAFYLTRKKNNLDERMGVIAAATQINYRNLYRSLRYSTSSFSLNSEQLHFVDRKNITVAGYGFYFFYHIGKYSKHFYAQFIGGYQPTSHFTEQMKEHKNSNQQSHFQLKYTPTFSLALGFRL